MDEISSARGFQWDQGNAEKNWDTHRVSQIECEQVFFNRPVVVVEESVREQTEPGYYALGQTDPGRLLFVVFTIRGQLIRVISARDMSRPERRAYQNARA
ncbi:MAG: BrnT family toxin [Chloroflexi bacterium]|nr:BrnT family toxin [Chloroflexota bacterium]